MYLSFFIFVNLLAVLFFYLMIKQYRQLTGLLKQNGMNNKEDLFSFEFINRVFKHFPEYPQVRQVQKKVVNNAVYAGLLLVIGQYLARLL